MNEFKKMIFGGIAAVALAACGGGGGGDNNVVNPPPPSAEEWVMLAADGGNNVTAYMATASSPIQTPIPQLGQSVNLGSRVLGEVHYANGKAFLTVSTGMPGGNGGIVVFDVATQQVEDEVELVGTVSGRNVRAVHVYLDPEAKFLWVNNDGPSGDNNPDSVFRIDVDPASPDYLTYTEIMVGNGHKKSAISRSSATKTVKKLFITSSLTEQRIDVIDDDSTSPTYGQVIKIVRNVGAVPHGMDYSPNTGLAFAGLTGGGMVAVSADPALLDTDSNGVVDIPDFDCAGACSGDPSVTKLTAGDSLNPTLFAGYIHTVTNEHDEDTVYTGGYSAGADMGFLTAVNPHTLDVNDIETVQVPGVSTSSFDNVGHHKIYFPARQTGSKKNVVVVIDIDHDSPTRHTILSEITVGQGGEHRNGEVSPDGRLAIYPNNCSTCNSVSVIDTETDTVIDTMTLPTGATPTNVGSIKLPFDAASNNH